MALVKDLIVQGNARFLNDAFFALIKSGTWNGSPIDLTHGGTAGETTAGKVLVSTATSGTSEWKLQSALSVGSATTATYASNVGAAGTAGTNYVTAANVISMYTWYNTITATDPAANTIIDKWNDIISFLAGLEDTSTLSGLLAGKANSTHNHAAGDITSGTLGIARGGTGLSTIGIYSILYASAADTLTTLSPNTTTTRKFLRMVGTGSSGAAPAWDTVTKTDVGLSNVENTALSSWVGSANITTLGTITTGTWSGTTIAVNKGGTGKTSWTKNGIIYASDTTTLAQITVPSTASKTYWLKCVTDSSSNPTYSFVELPAYPTLVGLMGSTAIGDSDEPVYWSGTAFTKCGPFSGTSHTHSNYVTLDTEQTITAKKVFKATVDSAATETIAINIGLCLSTYGDTKKNVSTIGLANEFQGWYKAGIGFERNASYDRGRIVFILNDTADNSTATYADIKAYIDRSGKFTSAGGYAKSGLTNPDTYMLLAGGGHQALSAISVSWENVTGKPDTYPASTHNHDDIYLKLVGGTLTGDLTIKANSGDSPKLIFQRGTLTDSLDDWRIFDTGGNLKFQHTTGSTTTWKDYVVFSATAGTVTINGSTVWHSGNFTPSDYRNNIVDLRTNPQTFNPSYLKDIVFISEADYTTLVSNGTITKNSITHTYNASNWYVIEDKVPAYAERAGNADYASYANLINIDLNSMSSWTKLTFASQNVSPTALHTSTNLQVKSNKGYLYLGSEGAGNLSDDYMNSSTYKGAILLGSTDVLMCVDSQDNLRFGNYSGGAMSFNIDAPVNIEFYNEYEGDWAYISAYLNWSNVTDKPDYITWGVTNGTTTSGSSYSLSNNSWTQTITLPSTVGSYILQIRSGKSTHTGVFSIGSDDNVKDEINLHLHGSGPRIYARTNGTKLELSKNADAASATTVVIKYRRLI